MVVAGEASGDLHGANLVRALKKKDQVSCFGIGGPAMENAGVDLIFPIKGLSVMGVTEVLAKLPSILKALALAKDALKQRHPDLLILIDFPDFNLKVAKAAKILDIPVLFYISPKIWASRPGRAKKLKKLVSHMALILPFEKGFYEQYDIPATYVGNPLLDTGLLKVSSGVQEKQGEKVIGLLPGSRVGEVARLLPVMMEAAKQLSIKNPEYRFLVSLASSIDSSWVEGMVSPYRGTVHAEIVPGEISGVFEKSDFLIAASGTVTLEAAIFGIPMVVVYKMSFISHWVAKMLVQVRFISLVNLIAGKAIVPELIQSQANPNIIAETTIEIMEDPERLRQMRNDLKNVRKLLGEPGASDRVADIALKMMDQR
jgi:lipid-A-disaccharide synthase